MNKDDLDNTTIEVRPMTTELQFEKLITGIRELTRVMVRMVEASEQSAEQLKRIADYIDDDVNGGVDTAEIPKLNVVATPPDHCPECGAKGVVWTFKEIFEPYPVREYRCPADGNAWGREQVR